MCEFLDSAVVSEAVNREHFSLYSYSPKGKIDV